MSKHTPGPWVFSAIDSTEGFLVVEKARPKSLVATVCKRNGCGWACPHEEPWANARLIAAAPELLAACTRTAEIIQGGDRFESLEPWAQEIVQSLNAAIAKAEGREVPHA